LRGALSIPISGERIARMGDWTAGVSLPASAAKDDNGWRRRSGQTPGLAALCRVCPRGGMSGCWPAGQREPPLTARRSEGGSGVDSPIFGNGLHAPSRVLDAVVHFVGAAPVRYCPGQGIGPSSCGRALGAAGDGVLARWCGKCAGNPTSACVRTDLCGHESAWRAVSNPSAGTLVSRCTRRAAGRDVDLNCRPACPRCCRPRAT
jgi:hypothetical protein